MLIFWLIHHYWDSLDSFTTINGSHHFMFRQLRLFRSRTSLDNVQNMFIFEGCKITLYQLQWIKNESSLRICLHIKVKLWIKTKNFCYFSWFNLPFHLLPHMRSVASWDRKQLALVLLQSEDTSIKCGKYDVGKHKKKKTNKQTNVGVQSKIIPAQHAKVRSLGGKCPWQNKTMADEKLWRIIMLWSPVLLMSLNIKTRAIKELISTRYISLKKGNSSQDSSTNPGLPFILSHENSVHNHECWLMMMNVRCLMAKHVLKFPWSCPKHLHQPI